MQTSRASGEAVGESTFLKGDGNGPAVQPRPPISTSSRDAPDPVPDPGALDNSTGNAGMSSAECNQPVQSSGAFT